MEINLEQVTAALKRIRAEHGDQDFNRALQGLFRDLLTKEGGATYMDRLLEELGRPDGVDVQAMRAEAAAKTPQPQPPPAQAAKVVEAAIKNEVPNCQTQAHFDLILQSWEALKIYLNAAFGFERETAEKARDALDRLLELAPQIAEAHQKLQEHPEATTNQDYIRPPKQLTEFETLGQLLLQLNEISTVTTFRDWYQKSKPRMDGIVTQKFRDELFDSIRAKKHELSN